MPERTVPTDAFAPGETATVAGVKIGVALKMSDTVLGVGRRRVDPSDGDTVVFSCRVHNGSDEAVRLPTRDAFDTQGWALPNLESHHFRDGETVRPSYLRLAAAYGDALVAPDTTVSGLVAYEMGSDSADPTVSITVGVADEKRTLTWRLTPTDAESEGGKRTPAPTPTPAPVSSQTLAVGDESPAESPDTDGDATGDSDGTPTDDDGTEATLSPRCPSCDDVVAPTHSYCGNCGASL